MRGHPGNLRTHLIEWKKDVGIETRKVQQRPTATRSRAFFLPIFTEARETSNLFPCLISKAKPENATIDCFQETVDDPCLVLINLDFPIGLMMSGQ